jgi:predicted nucleotidyltransferase component of viral defense system
MSPIDYKALYNLQDDALSILQNINHLFYLTGGTALARYYFNHRFSDDLDFFANDIEEAEYKKSVQLILEALKKLNLSQKDTQIWQSYAKTNIQGHGVTMKIDFVNDVGHRVGAPHKVGFGHIDTVSNILANKINCIIGRDEPKDIVDIVEISRNCSFSWLEMFYHTKEKCVINELDVARRLNDLPPSWLDGLEWLKGDFDKEHLLRDLKTISDDFFLAKENSLGKDKISIYDIRPKQNA